MGNPLSCDAVDMQDTVSLYVSGRLSEDAAAAFEQHLESCERCWGEVQLALQVRAARRETHPSAGNGTRRAVSMWAGMALAAACVLAVAGSVWYTARRQPVAPAEEVTRGASGIQITASRLSQGGIQVTWPVVDGASRYRLVVSLVDGTPLLTRDTGRVELTLAPADLPTPLPASLLMELRAENALGTRLVDHGPTTVPVSDPPPSP